MKITNYSDEYNINLSGGNGVATYNSEHNSLGSNTPLVESGAGTPGIGPQASAWDHVHPALVGGTSFGSNSNSVSSANAAGASSSNSRADHVHRGVATLAKSGSTGLVGDVTLTAGSNVTLTQSGNDISIASTGGGSTLPWLNVEDYGAVHDGSTDDTTAIQAAMDAAGTNALAGTGSTTVYFPNGTYVVGGALQDTGRSNAQLLLPRVNTTTTAPITIRLVGQEPVAPIVSVGATTIIKPTECVILKSTLSSGTGALLGAKGPSGSWQDGTALHLVMRAMNFRMVANPTNSALDFRYVMGIDLEDVLVDTGEWNLPSVTQPTTSTSYGLRTPSNVTSSGFAWLRTVNVVGFYHGFELSELSNSDMVHAWGCIRGFRVTAANHSILVKRLGSYECGTGLYCNEAAGSVYIDVQQFDTEHGANPTHPSWERPTYDIDDASGGMRGFVRFHRQDYGSAPGGDPLVNGAAGLSIDVGFQRWRRAVGYVEMPNVASTPPTPSQTGGTFYSATQKPTWKDSAGTAATIMREADTAGGDLSGTYPNPTVAKVNGIAVTGTPSSGQVITATGSSTATWQTPTGSTGGQILIADTHSTPLVFADLLQVEAQDDLLYAD